VSANRTFSLRASGALAAAALGLGTLLHASQASAEAGAPPPPAAPSVGLPAGHPPIQVRPATSGAPRRPPMGVEPSRMPPPKADARGAGSHGAGSHGAGSHGGGAHEGEHGGGHGECPGHGPTDPPHHINWFHGLLMVDNERSQQGGINSLLFRYNNPANPCDPKNEPPPFLASLLNFGVFAYVVGRFGKKPIADALKKRKQQIMADIETAQRLREEAAERLAQYEDQLDRLQETGDELLTEQRTLAEVERKAVLADAELRRERLLREARKRVEQELKAAKEQLVAEALAEAMAAAEALVQKRTQADEERLADEFLAQVGARWKAGETSSQKGFAPKELS
jgi:F-type H+-transporting ATPase subunit b